MVRCAVVGCNSDSTKNYLLPVPLMFFRFPKDKVLNKQYRQKCKRPSDFKTANARICSKHFRSDDFERNMKYELLNVPVPHNVRKLKRNAVPSLYLPGTMYTDTKKDSARSERQHKRSQTKVVEELLSTHSGKAFHLTSSVASKVWQGFATMATDSKTVKLIQKIGTHNGTFHCDEALACYMLKQLPEWKEAEIVRTRDPKILDECEIVVDVGGVYNPKTNRFDHHQKGFEQNLTMIRPDLAKNKTTKLSSAGLVYAHYGQEVIREILKVENYPISANCIPNLFTYIYDGFVEELDAIDNGIPMYAEGKPRYRINTHLSARVHRLNPDWNTLNPQPLDELFEKAMDLVGGEFRERVIEAATVWWPGREIIRNALNNRKKVHSSGEIMLLEERCPWKDHLHALEEELDLKEEVKFVVFHDPTGSWRVQGIPIQPDSFICRVFLHKKWRGVRDEELSSVAGISGCVFCHATGFIGGNQTKEGALEMALKSLAAPAADRE